MHDADTRGIRPQPRPHRLLALLLASALIVPASVGYAQPSASTRPLFQVTSRQWQHVHPRWAAYPAGSWAVQGGALTNRLTGVKFCKRPCRYLWQSLIAAPYHIPTTRYAIDVEMRYRGSLGGSPHQGLVLLTPKTSAGPVPWLFMDNSEVFGSCRANTPVLVGSRPTAMELWCASPFPPGSQPVWNPIRNTKENRWYRYRLEVRGKQCRYFIDGHLVTVLRYPRPAVGRGVVPGFFAIQPPSDAGSLVNVRIWVKSITITALPSPGHP